MPNTSSSNANSVEQSNYSYQLDSFETHLIDPEKKDAVWGYNIFVQNRINLKCAFPGGGGKIGAYNIDFDLIKQYAAGNQPVEIYKVQWSPQDKEVIYTGLNWQISPIIPTLRNRVLKEMGDVPIDVSCQAVDELANSQRGKDRERLKIEPELDKKLAGISAKIGYDQPIKSNFSKRILNKPQEIQGMDMSMDADEIDLFMSKDAGYYNQDVELANELCIQAVFEWNNYAELKRMTDEDEFDVGISTFRQYTNAYNGMPTYQYLRPDRVYTQQSQYRDYRDSKFWYYPVPATLADIMNYFGGELTERDVKEIWEKSAKRRPLSWGGGYPSSGGWDWRQWNLQDLRKVEIDMFYFEVKTENMVTYEVSKTRNGKDKVKKRNFDYKQPQESQYNKKKQPYYAEVIYRGYFIQGIEKVYNWGLLNDMYRSKEDPQHCSFTLNIYRASEKGLTEQMIPSANLYQLNFLKLQHAVVKSLPDGYFWNWDAINQPFIGSAGTITAETVIKMFTQTGSAPYHSLDEMGEPLLANANAPHMRAQNGLSPETKQYAEYMAMAQNQMAECIGISPTAEAINPNPKLLVGVSQQAASASASARYMLIKGVEQKVINTATYTSYCLQEIAKNNPDTWAKIKRMVGAMNTAVIESMDDLPLHEFGIYIKSIPTQEEKNLINQLVLSAYSQANPTIDLSDAFNILFMPNPKLAMRLFELRQKKKKQAMMQMQGQQMQMEKQTEMQMAQLKLAIAQMTTQSQQATAEINGKYTLLATEMKEAGDLNRKVLQEITKLHLAEHDKQHDHTISDKENVQTLQQIGAQKEADISAIKLQGQNAIDLAKAQPKPQAA